MVGADRTTAAHLEQALLAEPRSYSFFQAYRLLRLLTGNGNGVAADPHEHIRVRPNLTLAFPEADIDRIETVGEGNDYSITANFLGLYGVSSPLPTFYTEDLIDERSRDQSAQRDFVDIFNYSIYHLLFGAWAKSRPLIKVIEERDSATIDRLFALIGLGDARLRDGLPESQGLLPYLGLLTQFPRTALGLQTMLADALGGIPVTVTSCKEVTLDIPEDQRLALGRTNSLGENSFLGEKIDDRTTSIQVRIGPVSYHIFHELLPGAPLNARLRFYTRFYTIHPVRTAIELVLERGAAKPARLGADDDARLGLDTWLYAGEHDDQGYASFWL
jgi:type VI secretion system protein ImpH